MKKAKKNIQNIYISLTSCQFSLQSNDGDRGLRVQKSVVCVLMYSGCKRKQSYHRHRMPARLYCNLKKFRADISRSNVQADFK